MEDVWYLDSGCSKHTASKKEFHIEYECKKDSYVTFGDGSKNKFVRTYMLNIEGMPKFITLYVVGLKANLISFS
jgi:hypothetical protein